MYFIKITFSENYIVEFEITNKLLKKNDQKNE